MGIKKLKDGSFKYNTFKIIPAPTNNFPNMVRLVSTKKSMNIDKRFVNILSAVKYASKLSTEDLINRTGTEKEIIKELQSIGISSDNETLSDETKGFDVSRVTHINTQDMISND